jgi:hypothetical protein
MTGTRGRDPRYHTCCGNTGVCHDKYALSIQHNSWNQSPPEGFSTAEFFYGLFGPECEDNIDITLSCDVFRRVGWT